MDDGKVEVFGPSTGIGDPHPDTDDMGVGGVPMQGC